MTHQLFDGQLTSSIGPKMYVAFGSGNNLCAHGTTNLHLDVTDAVNVMTWTTRPEDPGAIWHIFSAADSEAVRNFIQTKHLRFQNLDPIQSHAVYLSPQLLGELKRERGIVPKVIEQRVGDAVCIPAKCLHQVCQCSCPLSFLIFHRIWTGSKCAERYQDCVRFHLGRKFEKNRGTYPASAFIPYPE